MGWLNRLRGGRASKASEAKSAETSAPKSIEGLGPIETEEQRQQAIRVAVDRVAGFGGLMQKHVHHVVVDESELPAPMEHMIPAFQVAYMAQPDSAMKDQIIALFQELAMFRPDIGAPIDGFSVYVERALREHPDDPLAQAEILSSPQATKAQELEERMIKASLVLAEHARSWDDN